MRMITWLVLWIGWCTGVVNLTQAAIERAAIESPSNNTYQLREGETVRERDDKKAV